MSEGTAGAAHQPRLGKSHRRKRKKTREKEDEVLNSVTSTCSSAKIFMSSEDNQRRNCNLRGKADL